MLVTLSPSCEAENPRVEVFVNGCLEPRDLTVDNPLVPCGFLWAQSEGKLTARGASVQWGPLNVSCPGDGGLLFPVTLECPPAE